MLINFRPLVVHRRRGVLCYQNCIKFNFEFLRVRILLVFSFSIQLLVDFGKNPEVAMYPAALRLGRDVTPSDMECLEYITRA